MTVVPYCWLGFCKLTAVSDITVITLQLTRGHSKAAHLCVWLKCYVKRDWSLRVEGWATLLSLHGRVGKEQREFYSFPFTLLETEKWHVDYNAVWHGKMDSWKAEGRCISFFASWIYRLLLPVLSFRHYFQVLFICSFSFLFYLGGVRRAQHWYVIFVL